MWLVPSDRPHFDLRLRKSVSACSFAFAVRLVVCLRKNRKSRRDILDRHVEVLR